MASAAAPTGPTTPLNRVVMASLVGTTIEWYDYSGVSIAYQLTSIVAGSLAPIIALLLYREYDSALPIAIYVGVACTISGLTALLASETKGIELAEIR